MSESQTAGNIYALLVNDSEKEGNKLEGYIAYCLYKRDKLEYMRVYQNSHKSATDEEIQSEKDNYRITSSNNINSINKWKKEAKDIVEDFREKDLLIVAAQLSSQKVENNTYTNITSWWNSNQCKRTWGSIATNVTGALIYSILLIIFGIIINHGANFEITLKGNTQTEQATSSPANPPANTINYK